MNDLKRSSIVMLIISLTPLIFTPPSRAYTGLRDLRQECDEQKRAADIAVANAGNFLQTQAFPALDKLAGRSSDLEGFKYEKKDRWNGIVGNARDLIARGNRACGSDALSQVKRGKLMFKDAVKLTKALSSVVVRDIEEGRSLLKKRR